MPWKRRVLKKIADNKAAKPRANPWNIEQLAKIVDAPKNGLNKLLDLKREPPQLTSEYVRAITDELGILPPIVEDDEDDPDFARDVLLLRSLDVEARRALMGTAGHVKKKSQ